jgi:hypothetical protein
MWHTTMWRSKRGLLIVLGLRRVWLPDEAA